MRVSGLPSVHLSAQGWAHRWALESARLWDWLLAPPLARSGLLGLGGEGRALGADGDGAFNPRTGAGHVAIYRVEIPSQGSTGLSCGFTTLLFSARPRLGMSSIIAPLGMV